MTIKELLTHSGRPTIFTKGNTNFWNDPHISKDLLAAHLDPEWDAASRTPKNIDRTIAWLKETVLKEDNMSVLDLGCGPGLYAERLAKLGHPVTGVDFSQRSIDHATKSSREAGLDIAYVYKNYLEIDFKEQYDLVMLIFCDFGALTNSDRDILLGKIYTALKPGGSFVFDTFTEAFADGVEEKKSWEVTGDGFWAEGTHLVLEESFNYPEEQVVLRQTLVAKESGKVDVHRTYDHYYHEKDLRELLDRFNYEKHSFHEDVIGETNFATQAVRFTVTRKPVKA